MKKIGLIVNPVAGMGGSVGLKGTDGEMYKRALELGARAVTPARTKEFLSEIRNKNRMNLVMAPGKMGADFVTFPTTVIGNVGKRCSGEDTKRIALKMISLGIELLVFVGGDGTARDIFDAVGLDIPVVAVPSGVKIFSAVFAFSTRAAAGMVDAFIEGAGVSEEEVLDIDEQAFRDNRLDSKLYGYLLVPQARKLLQGGKECSNTGPSSDKIKKEIADYVVGSMKKGVLYLLGPGTTVKAITDTLGVRKTLLGVDAVIDGNLVGSDLNEAGILDLLGKSGQSCVIVTPIGGNGFIFGRGNKQLSPEVLKRIGKENIIIVGTMEKLNKLQALRVDTGDYSFDRILAGNMEVVVGNKESLKIEVLS